MSKPLGFSTEDKLRRIANRLECDATEVIPELLAEHNSYAAAVIMDRINSLIYQLHEFAKLLSEHHRKQDSES